MLPKFEGFILVLHILGFFCVLIPLVYLSEHTSAHDVFTQFLNTGNWPTQGLSFFVGLIGMGFSFLGGDATVHVSYFKPTDPDTQLRVSHRDCSHLSDG